MSVRPHDVVRRDGPGGVIHLAAREALGPVTERTTDWLDHWAQATPDAVFLAERSGDGWREVSYSEAHDTARALAVGLLGLGLGSEKPLLVINAPFDLGLHLQVNTQSSTFAERGGNFAVNFHI